MKKIMCMMGTRPEIIKMAPIIRKLQNASIKVRIFLSGQHYDYEMCNQLIETLKMPPANYFGTAGSLPECEQISRILKESNKAISRERPDMALVVGDTNTAFACALAAYKNSIPLGHVEAGCRFFDMSVPEEFNRRMIERCASLLFASTKKDAINLVFDGYVYSKIFITGNPLVDACEEHLEMAKNIFSNHDLYFEGSKDGRIIVTAHHQENVNDKKKLENLIDALIMLDNFSIVFPIHPRTLKNLKKFNLLQKVKKHDHIIITKPLDYMLFLYHLDSSDLVITDSGGLIVEASILRKPVVIIGKSTEWYETVLDGVAILAGNSSAQIYTSAITQLKKNMSNFPESPYKRGASEKIVNILLEHTGTVLKPWKYNVRKYGYPIHRAFFVHKNSEFVDATVEKIQKKMKGMIVAGLFNEQGMPEPIFPSQIIKEGYIIILFGGCLKTSKKPWLIHAARINECN